MATVTITITDRPGDITVVADSDLPIPVEDDNNPIVDQLADAQAAGMFAAMTVDDSTGSSERRTLVHRGPR